MNFLNIKIKNIRIIEFVFAIIGIGVLSYTAYTMGAGRTGSASVSAAKFSITDNQAEEYFYATQYNNAIDEYNKIYESDNQSPKWLVKIAEVYSVKGDIENSRKYLEKVKGLNSKDPSILNYIVFTEFMNKDNQLALEDGQRALALDSSDKSLIKTMFTVYMANNQMDRAKTILKTYPVDTKSAYDLAEYSRMLMIIGNKEEGFEQLKAAWTLNKDEFKIYDVLSQIAVYNRDELLEDVSKLMTQSPDDLTYKMWLAKIYSLNEETADQAGKILDEIKSQNTGKIEIKLIEAAVLQNSKKSDEADSLIQTVINKNKDDYTVLHTAGWFYLNKKDLDKAEKYCRESIIKNKNYPDNYGFLMPEILKAQGKSVDGEPYFRTALLKEPYNYNIMLNIANYYWYTTKNSEKALEYFKFAEIVKPDDPEIKYNMALIHLTNDRVDDSIALLKKCISLSDAVPKYHRTLGTIYLTKGNSAEAIKEIRYAYAADQSDVMTLNNAGCYYITIENNLDRGLYNLQKAAEGLNALTDKYTIDNVNENYNKAKKLVDQYKNSKGNESLKIPDFVLFY